MALDALMMDFSGIIIHITIIVDFRQLFAIVLTIRRKKRFLEHVRLPA
jgi:hypothetical protein